jgi:hypothetical protein
MAGKVRLLIDELIAVRTRGAPGLLHFVKVNLVLRGVDPDAYDHNSPDDPAKIALLESLIREFKSPRG